MNNKGDNMLLNKELNRNKIQYKMQEYNPNIYIYKILNKVNIVTIIAKTNVFLLDRDLFYYLSNQKEMYSFVLKSIDDNQLYYLEFKNKTNWLNSSFERCDKEELYFGKIILNNKSNIKTIIDKIKRY